MYTAANSYLFHTIIAFEFSLSAAAPVPPQSAAAAATMSPAMKATYEGLLIRGRRYGCRRCLRSF
jgi:hypothetical protein